MLQLINTWAQCFNELNEVATTSVFVDNKKVDAICITAIKNGEWKYLEITDINKSSLDDELKEFIGVTAFNIIKHFTVKELVTDDCKLFKKGGAHFVVSTEKISF